MRPSTHPTLSIACIYQIPLWRRMLACLLTSNFYQVHSRDSLLLLPVIWLPPPTLPCPCNISLHHWPQQPAFVLESSYWVMFSFPFLLPSVFCLDVWLPIPFRVICNATDSSRLKTAPYQNLIHCITNSIMPCACQQDFAQCKKGKPGWKAWPGQRLKHTPEIALMQRRSHIKDGCSCMSAQYSSISQASKCCSA